VWFTCVKKEVEAGETTFLGRELVAATCSAPVLAKVREKGLDWGWIMIFYEVFPVDSVENC
jgi:hypothetical protein